MPGQNIWRTLYNIFFLLERLTLKISTIILDKLLFNLSAPSFNNSINFQIRLQMVSHDLQSELRPRNLWLHYNDGHFSGSPFFLWCQTSPLDGRGPAAYVLCSLLWSLGKRCCWNLYRKNGLRHWGKKTRLKILQSPCPRIGALASVDKLSEII